MSDEDVPLNALVVRGMEMILHVDGVAYHEGEWLKTDNPHRILGGNPDVLVGIRTSGGASLAVRRRDILVAGYWPVESSSLERDEEGREGRDS